MVHGRRWMLGGVVAAALVVAACSAAPGSRPSGGSTGACPMFPADNVWHADVSGLAVHPRSTAWRNAIGATKGLKADFGSGLWNGGTIGIPWTSVGVGQARVPISFDYADESDPGPYPIPRDAPVESGGDHHVLVVDNANCLLYEVYAGDLRPDGSWAAGSGAVWDLRSNTLRPDGWTSSDAAGLPVLSGLVRYEEVAAGRIDHPIRFTAPVTQRAYLWPARHFASSNPNPDLPPMGAWFRLRADFDTSRLAPQARVVAETLKVHGMILADNGSSWYLSGAPDERWDNAGLRGLATITGNDLVAVDTAPMMVEPNSGRRR